MLKKIKAKATQLKREIVALYLAGRDPRTPWYAKAMIAAVVAYALSPIDLIPDFIPILGYLDDLVLLPIGIWLAIRMIPRGNFARLSASVLRRLIFNCRAIGGRPAPFFSCG